MPHRTRRIRLESCVYAVTLLTALAGTWAHAEVITFDNVPDGTIISNQYASLGALFSNTIVLTSGIDLNEFEFPPHSLPNAASDNLGPITVQFSSVQTSVSGYFTYAQPLTITALNSSGDILTTAHSAFDSNMALSGSTGSSPNEFIQITASNISEIIVAGSPSGGSYTVDDLTFSTVVPEPNTLLLSVFAGILLLSFLRRRARRRS